MLTEDQAVNIYYNGTNRTLVYRCRICGKDKIKTRKAELAKHTGRCADCYREMRSNRSNLGGMSFRLCQLYVSYFSPEQILSAIVSGTCSNCKKNIPAPRRFYDWIDFLHVLPSSRTVGLMCYECRLIRDVPVYRMGV